jgi:Zn-dependent M28 family amino/carboxypeptidase
MKSKRFTFGLIAIGFFLLLTTMAWFYLPAGSQNLAQLHFSGERALKDVIKQVEFGPRIPDSTAHSQTIQYIQAELKLVGWNSSVLNQSINGHTAYNILATRNSETPIILIGAHYDSRLYADNDPNPANHTVAVPGANDGASGVAVLLELARNLPRDSTPAALLFIDIEDNGQIPGWDWIQGSRAFAADMPFRPLSVVIVDMIGDSDLNIYMEKSSDKVLTSQLWKTAKSLGYQDAFLPSYKYQVIDDHTPFLEKGIRAVDIIDLDYPYWHTVQDLPDKVSASSLQKIGDTLLKWINDYGPCQQRQDCIEK